MFDQLKKRKTQTIILPRMSLFIGFFASMPLIRIAGYSIYVWLLVIIFIICFLSLRIRLTKVDLLLVLVVSLTYIFSLHSLSQAYQNEGTNALIGLILALVVGRSLTSTDGIAYSDKVLLGIIFASKIQSIWIFIQVIGWSLFSIDLNGVVFNQFLHMRAETSQYKETGYVATGLCWNAGGIAACLIIGFMLERNLLWKILILVAGICTQSSTIAIGLLLCIFYFIIKYTFEYKIVSNLSKMGLLFIFVTIATLIAAITFIPFLSNYIYNIFSTLTNRASHLLSLSDSLDSSTSAHLNYYLNLPELLRTANTRQLLMGYGLNASGLPYTELTNQYFWLDSWFVESDPINSILSMGLIGSSVLLFWFLTEVKTAFDSKSIALPLLLIFLILGFFYNILSVAYFWLIFIIISLVDATNKTTRI